MAYWEEKREYENTKLWMSWEQKELKYLEDLKDQIKSNFHSFWRAIIKWKNKK